LNSHSDHIFCKWFLFLEEKNQSISSQSVVTGNRQARHKANASLVVIVGEV